MINNKQKAIIYLRKSTDREDRQQITIETQKKYCEKLAEDNDFETYIIEEHKSAKEEWKRPWFKKMISKCKKWNYDYVIAYDPTRISRNTIDAAHFTELINKWHIKWFYSAESRQFFNGTDIFSALMLGISFLMSKADNQMRSNNTRKKMEMYFKQGRVMWNPPFWYKNHQYFDDFWRLQHDVIVIEKEAKLVQKAFEMRKEWAYLKDIQKFIRENWYPKKSICAVEHMLKNLFYIWIQKWKLWEAEIKMPWYRPIISCVLYQQVNTIRRKLKKKKKVEYDAYFKWLLFDEYNKPFISYETTNRFWNKYIYYRTQTHNKKKLNISQNKLLKKLDNYIEDYNFNSKNIDILEQKLKKEFNITNQIKNEKDTIIDELSKIEKEKKILAKKVIEWVFDDDTYKELLLWYLENKKLLEERLNNLSENNRNINTLIRKGVELLRKLYSIYKTKNPWQKVRLLNLISVELFIKDDFSLIIQENRLINYMKSFLFLYGRSCRIRTYVSWNRNPSAIPIMLSS